MTFAEVEAATSRFREVLHAAVKIDKVSVPNPEEPLDELHFFRLVMWCYVYLVEVVAGPRRHLQGIMRGSNPSTFAKVAHVVRLVESLRTYSGHQLAETKRDADIRAFVVTWLDANGGERQWEARARELCNLMVEAINLLNNTWVGLNTADPEMAVLRMLETIERSWPAHVFDGMVEAAVAELSINGFDVVAYRKIHLEGWVKLAGCFSDRAQADLELRNAIRSELKITFGR